MGLKILGAERRKQAFPVRCSGDAFPKKLHGDFRDGRVKNIYQYQTLTVIIFILAI